jgi:hypothetical protein
MKVIPANVNGRSADQAEIATSSAAHDISYVGFEDCARAILIAARYRLQFQSLSFRKQSRFARLDVEELESVSDNLYLRVPMGTMTLRRVLGDATRHLVHVRQKVDS